MSVRRAVMSVSLYPCETPDWRASQIAAEWLPNFATMIALFT
jgi:hypothetical protein